MVGVTSSRSRIVGLRNAHDASSNPTLAAKLKASFAMTGKTKHGSFSVNLILMGIAPPSTKLVLLALRYDFNRPRQGIVLSPHVTKSLDKRMITGNKSMLI